MKSSIILGTNYDEVYEVKDTLNNWLILLCLRYRNNWIHFAWNPSWRSMLIYPLIHLVGKSSLPPLRERDEWRIKTLFKDIKVINV